MIQYQRFQLPAVYHGLKKILKLNKYTGVRGGAMVEALRYKPEGRGFDFRWCRWIFS
jgi:hypothetical protein